MLNRIAVRISHFLIDNSIIKAEDAEIYEYGLELLLATVFETFAVLTVSIFVEKFLFTLLFLISFCALRKYAGGYHADSHLKCFLTLIFVYSVFLLMIYLLNEIAVNYLSVIFSAVSEGLVIVMAPVESEYKPLSDEEKQKYRKVSIFIAAIETVLVVLLHPLVPVKYGVILIYLAFAISFGQLSAALSLVAVKIINLMKGSQNNGNVENNG